MFSYLFPSACQDVDQFFGRLASWIARHRRLETPNQFVAIIQNFLNTLQGRPWPVEARRRAFLLTQMRSWTTWLSKCGMTLHGHTGPSAPHVFSFLRRHACAGICQQMLDHPDCVSGSPQHECDVVLFCKQWMASPLHSQLPLVVFRASAVGDLELDSPPVSVEKRPMTRKYVNHVLKFVPLLRASPYCMVSAADYLEAWVNGVAPHAPLLDISACCLQRGAWRDPSGPRVPPAAALVPDSGASGEDIEPLPGMVALARVVRRPLQAPEHRQQQQQASALDARSALVYSCAVALFEHHGMNMVEAIAIGERCWQGLCASSVDKGIGPLAAEAEGRRGRVGRAPPEGRGRGRGRVPGRGRVGQELFAADQIAEGSDGEAGAADVLDVVGRDEALDLAL